MFRLLGPLAGLACLLAACDRPSPGAAAAQHLQPPGRAAAKATTVERTVTARLAALDCTDGRMLWVLNDDRSAAAYACEAGECERWAGACRLPPGLVGMRARVTVVEEGDRARAIAILPIE